MTGGKMNEIWKPIRNFETYYLVSNLGRIKGLKRLLFNGKGFYYKNEKILKSFNDGNGYKILGLNKNGLRTNFKIHRLVAQAFIPNPENKPQVNHINGDKLDNRVENLEWVTASENALHSYKLGLQTTKHIGSKLTNKDVIGIRRLSIVRSRKELSIAYNVSYRTICNIVNRDTWKHI